MSSGQEPEISPEVGPGTRRTRAPTAQARAAEEELAPVHFDRPALAAILSRMDLGACLKTMFSERSQSPLRHRVDASHGREILLMPAYQEKFAGAKVLSIVPGNAHSARPVISGLFLLFDFETGVPLATMDAGELTAWRTAAVSALAADALARKDASELTVLGAGHLAPFLALTLARVRPIRRVNMWARRVGEAERVAEIVRKSLDGVDVSVCTDLRQAVHSGEIVTAATRSQAPLISGEWLRSGTHVDLVGGYRPDMRELDDAGIQRGRIFVDTREAALTEAGDLIDPVKRGLISQDAIAGDLFALISGKVGRASPEEITIFKSVGTGLADLAVAIAVWDESLTLGQVSRAIP